MRQGCVAAARARAHPRTPGAPACSRLPRQQQHQSVTRPGQAAPAAAQPHLAVILAQLAVVRAVGLAAEGVIFVVIVAGLARRGVTENVGAQASCRAGCRGRVRGARWALRHGMVGVVADQMPAAREGGSWSHNLHPPWSTQNGGSSPGAHLLLPAPQPPCPASGQHILGPGGLRRRRHGGGIGRGQVAAAPRSHRRTGITQSPLAHTLSWAPRNVKAA